VRHGGGSDVFDAAPGQRLADAAVHARGGELLGALGQGFDRGVDGVVSSWPPDSSRS
jgi:hypothetical protein